MTSAPLTRCALISLSLLVGGACDSAEQAAAPEAEAKEAVAKAEAEAKAAVAKAEAESKAVAAKAEAETKAAAAKAAAAKAGDAKADDAKAADAKAADAKPGEPGGLAKMVDGVRDSVDAKASTVGKLVGKATDHATTVAGNLVESASGSTMDLGVFYWVEGGSPPSMIDIIDIPVPEGGDDPVLALANEYDYPDGHSATLPADATLPKGFAVTDEWVVLTPTGERRAKAKAYGASGGAGESHFLVVLDVEAKGLAVRAGDWTGKKAAVTLREAEPLDLTKEPGKSLWAAMRPAVTATITGPAKKYMGRKKLGAKHVKLWEGRFKDGFTHMVSFTYAKNPDAIGDDHVSGFLLADATGRVEAVFGPPELGIDSSEVHYLVDLDGDGQDEVVWNSFYYEGDYTMLMAWDARGGMHNRTLTGDGA